MCRKEGQTPAASPAPLETLLRCPDCRGELRHDSFGLSCPCGYRAADEGGVYNLLPSKLRAELYPGDREDAIDFSLPGHEARLRDGWYDLEGEYGNWYRWIGARATAVLRRVRPGPHRLRVRGFAHPGQFEKGQPVVELIANGVSVARQPLDRVGLFVLEVDLPDADEYTVEIAATPEWTVPEDDRIFSVNISMIRLVGGMSET
jgi:hypothetical protein